MESAFGYTFFAVLVGGGGIWVEWCSGIGMELVNGGCGCSGETWVKLGLFFLTLLDGAFGATGCQGLSCMYASLRGWGYWIERWYFE